MEMRQGAHRILLSAAPFFALSFEEGCQALDRVMPRRPLRSQLRTGFGAVEDAADAVPLRRIQAGFVVIEVEGAFRFEADQALADGPIFRTHF